ncbi:MAG: cell division protein FtsZ [bacterium]|nr:cell division protein FtsZ [bacterium]
MASNGTTKKNGFETPIARVKVIGVGGGGGNAVSRMSCDFPIRNVEFVAVNTDAQDLDFCGVKQKLYIGKNLTRGLGTGMNSDLGRQAAEENRSEITDLFQNTDIVFVTAGMGGGTGGGASPVIAEAAKQSGALTIAVVTKPFTFEGAQRAKLAQDALLKLKDKVDALIVVPNDRIFSVINKDTPIMKAFEAIDDVLRNAVQGIVELVVTPGIINIDFADVRTIMQDAGSALVGVGVSGGQDRAMNAVNFAVNSPLLEATIEGAKGVLFGVSGGRDIKMNEVNDIAKVIAEAADPSAKIIFGAYYDRKLKPGQIKVTFIATGFNGGKHAGSLFSSLVGARSAEFAGSQGGRENPMDGGLVNGFFAREVDAAEPAKQEKPAADQKKQDDVWDIPTFLRKRRR